MNVILDVLKHATKKIEFDIRCVKTCIKKQNSKIYILINKQYINNIKSCTSLIV